MANNKAKGTPPAAQVAETPVLKVRYNVSNVASYPGGQIVRLNAIDDLDGVNKSWAKGSPVSVVELDITEENAQAIFETGKTFESAWTEVLPVNTPLT